MHPTRLGTHRRIADAIEAGTNEVSGIAARLGMTPASIRIALSKMSDLGYVVRDGTCPPVAGNGRAANLWAIAPGAVVPADSGAPARNRTSAETYLGRVVDALRDGPKTRTALIKASSIAWCQLEDVVGFLMTSGCVTRTMASTGGRPGFTYRLDHEPASANALTVRAVPRSAIEPAEEELYDSASGTFEYAFEPSREVVACNPAKTTVALAACIDGYVDATATGQQSPCNQCPTGRARRADYAGSDFEDGDDE
jgi:hypothetical protein